MRDYSKTARLAPASPSLGGSKSGFLRDSRRGGKEGLPGYRIPSSFKNRVLNVVKDIPKGKMLSYKEVAKRAGSPGAFRAVGSVLNKNEDSKVPCHRVIRSDGTIGCYNRGSEKKLEILKREGAV